MSKKTTSLVSSLFGLLIFLFLAFGSSEDKNNNTKNQIKNNSYSIETNNNDNNSNKKKESSKKKDIVSIAEQKRLVKSFTQKITNIEKPATKSNADFLEILKYYQEGGTSSNEVIKYAKYAKRQCDNAMFSLSDLEVPNNLPNEIESLLDDARNDLKISWSIKGTTYNNIIKYFKDYNPKRIDYFNNDVSEAHDYTVSASIKILKVQSKLGIQNYSVNPKPTNNNQSQVRKSGQEVNKNYSKPKDSENEQGGEKIESQNDTDKKTKRQIRKEEREKRKADKKRR